MPAKLIVRVHSDDRVEVKVEGLTARDATRPKREKLCERVTQRIEQDLGTVIHREYAGDGTAGNLIELSEDDRVELGR